MVATSFAMPQLACEGIDATDQSDETRSEPEPEPEPGAGPTETTFGPQPDASRCDDNPDGRRKHAAPKWTRRHDRRLEQW